MYSIQHYVIKFVSDLQFNYSECVTTTDLQISRCHTFAVIKFWRNQRQSSGWAPVLWSKTSKSLFGPVIFSVFIQNYIEINSRISFGPVNSNFHFEDCKGVVKSFNSKKDRQYNGLKKKDKQTNIGWHLTTQRKHKLEQQEPKKNGVELGCPGRVCSSCSIGFTLFATLVTNPGDK